MTDNPTPRKPNADLIAFRQPDPVTRAAYWRAAERKGVPLSVWIRSTLDDAVTPNRRAPQPRERRTPRARAA
jgi:hypothetical protein